MTDYIDYDKLEMNRCIEGKLYNTTFRGRDGLVTQALLLCQKYNQIPADKKEYREKLIRDLFGKVGKNPVIEPNIFCGFGFNVEVGDDFFANNNCNFMDPAKIVFGNNVFVGPNCSFYTAHHPINYKLRNEFYEWAYPIYVGDNVWFGGGCIVLPGITIGSNVVIGAGSVVTKDIPDNCIAIGNPCKILRFIDENGNELKDIREMKNNVEYGKKIWVFSDVDMYTQEDFKPYSHEILTITNCTNSDATIQITALFTDKDPEYFVLKVDARRVKNYRLDYPVGEDNYQIPKGQYSLLLESNIPIVSVLGRLERSKDSAYYEMNSFYM